MVRGTKQRNYGIDALKCLMALWVLIQHARPWEDLAVPPLEALRSMLTAVAVGFFFLCSGYFLVKPGESLGSAQLQQRLDRRTRGMLRLYLIWTALYFPINIYGEAVIYRSGLVRGTVNLASGVLLRGCNYNSWQLWYLLALVVSFWIIRVLGKRGWQEKQLLILSVGLLAAGAALDAWNGLAPNRLLSLFYMLLGTRNGLFTGLFFVMAGVWMRRLPAPGRLGQLLLIAGGMAFGCLTIRLPLLPVLGAGAAAAGLFHLGRSLKAKDGPFLGQADTVSKVIYFSHMLLCTAFELLLPPSSWYHTLVCLLSMAATLALALAVCRTSRGWVKKLFE